MHGAGRINLHRPKMIRLWPYIECLHWCINIMSKLIFSNTDVNTLLMSQIKSKKYYLKTELKIPLSEKIQSFTKFKVLQIEEFYVLT